MAYTGAYIFGDSLVDSGNALKLARWYGNLTFSELPDGAPTPELGYFAGRFSNGYAFTDLISNKTIGLVSKPIFPFHFEDPWLGIPISPWTGDPSGNNLNFAYGGAQIIQEDEVVPDLDDQTDAFRDAVDGDADPNALYLVTMGGNDVRSLAPADEDPASQATAYLELNKRADQLIHELGQLIDMGAKNILLTGIPDVGLIPEYDSIIPNGVLEGAELVRAAAATQYSIYLDTLIRTKVIPALQAKGANVTYVPIMDYTDANGQKVTGALSAMMPTLEALHGLPPGTLTTDLLDHRSVLFFDQVHPNAQAQALVAAYAHAKLTGAAMVETMPLLGADVDYRTTATIGAAGEIDKMVIAMAPGTTYTFQLLGVSSLTNHVAGQLGYASLPAGALLADSALRLLTSGGAVIRSDNDSGIGLDSVLSFAPSTAGNYTLEMSGVGSLTGTYVMTATVTGAAMTVGNSYTVSSASTLVLEGRGGLGIDTVRTSVSYALAAGSEIEALRTTNDRGKTALNLTGNEFDQTITGNSAANVIEGKAGADTLYGLGGSDRFILGSPTAAAVGGSNVDRIMDYGSGDVVDVTQVLSVAAGTNVSSLGYLRVTTGGLIQVDLNGGGNEWVTLSTVNGTGAVTLRYLSGGTATNVSLSRVAGVASTAALTSADGGSAMDVKIDLLGAQHDAALMF